MVNRLIRKTNSLCYSKGHIADLCDFMPALLRTFCVAYLDFCTKWLNCVVEVEFDRLQW